MADHYELGKKGEQVACDFLLEKGYEILSRNYHFQKAEIDIIAQVKELLVVVEVKTRTSVYYGNPQDFVNEKKIKLLVKAINKYVDDNDIDLEIRFDIVAIVFEKNKFSVEHIEDAFLHF
ncbi:putative endonuclease [Tenacibaculum sp. MAR_2009_124]|uniref:YraN family protein n=1 Tax=Tenacibaculum sp. MAR_2009_124 TaxID=1250059 RepID=UPI00089D73C9|nr:YraN family protein [Tenacibaculum sp. MAR_2009_124]SEB99289.1 putative endonuclease [Tenacibaculum sp. MAR_2009_124]